METNILFQTIEHKMDQCRGQNIMTHTNFLDYREHAAAAKAYKGTGAIFWGGYEDAERVITLFLPDYLTMDDIKAEDCPLSVIRVSLAKGARKLTHRDYLGSLLGLGIDRSVTGDIIVRDDGADIVVLSSMADFILTNYDKAGRENLKLELIPIGDIDMGTVNITEKGDTVASLRVDNLVASAFNLSRNKAQEAVRLGLVFINGLQMDKPDALGKEGDKVVLRGNGKAVLKEIGNRTRKDRLFVTWEVYK